jgi:hypothetical protein
VDLRAGRGRQAGAAGEVIGVDMGVHDVGDAQAVKARDAQVLPHVPLRVDDCRDPAVGHEIGGAGEVFVEDLSKHHGKQS